nr:putative integron gene cassette protein [uncultured bacterium]
MSKFHIGADSKQRTTQRHCYCDLWESNPDVLQSQNLPHGFCGICERCGQPGHSRHAPAAAPYTSAWCDSYYRITSIRNYSLWLFVAVICICTWLLFRGAIHGPGA